MILPIYIYGQPVLRKVAEDITPDYPQLKDLINDMWETLAESDGIGLAAPQIGKPIRLSVIDLDVLSEDLPEYKGFRQVFINPTCCRAGWHSHIKGKPTEIKTFRDLGKEGVKVIVNPNSMSYHLMMDYGWGENAIPSSDLREVIQQVSAHEDGQIVWNTLSLKWLMNRYHIDNLQLTPVNMPHGEKASVSKMSYSLGTM